MEGRLSAPRPSTPSCAPPPCVRFRPARAGSRLDHRRFNGPLFLLRSAVSRKRSASDTSQFRPPRAQARWPCMPADGTATAGLHPAGATEVHLTTGRMQEHQIPRQRSGPMAVARWSCSPRAIPSETPWRPTTWTAEIRIRSCRQTLRRSTVRCGQRFKAACRATAAPADRMSPQRDREPGLAARQIGRSWREERVSGEGGFQAAGAMLTSRVTVSAAAS